MKKNHINFIFVFLIFNFFYIFNSDNNNNNNKGNFFEKLKKISLKKTPPFCKEGQRMVIYPIFGPVCIDNPDIIRR